MERVSDFVFCGYGCGFGDGSGGGLGDGSVAGGGRGYGLRRGVDYGGGCANGSGTYDGRGCGSCTGDGYGDGSDYGDFVKLKSYNGKRVYDIDGVATLIFSVHGNLAKCKTINNDLTLSDCYVAKNGKYFAHGETAQEAISALREKLICYVSVDEKIAEFCKTYAWGVKYPTRDFYRWHNLLTGSCEYGRNKFAKEHGVDLDGEMTVVEFIELTADTYGSEIIKKLNQEYNKTN